MPKAALAALATLALGQTYQSKVEPAEIFPGGCTSRLINGADLPLRFHWLGENCLRLDGGFDSAAGSFANASLSRDNLLHLGETLSLAAEYGVRRRRIQAGFSKASLFAKGIEAGFDFYAERFGYNQARESSIFSFQRNIPTFDGFQADDLLRYISHSHGVTGFIGYRPPGTFSRVELAYGYDVSGVRPLTASASDYFQYLTYGAEHFKFNGDYYVYYEPRVLRVRTSKFTVSYQHNTIDNPAGPTHGKAILVSTGVAGLAGVKTIESTVQAKYFHPGFKSGHVLGIRARGRVLAGYSGMAAPPFVRYYLGGEDDIRGFDSWTISPVAYEPSSAVVNVLNSDGSQRVQKVVVNGEATLVNVTTQIPVYRIVSVGGDTSALMNLDYRIPLLRPWTLILFADAGENHASFSDHLRITPARVDQLNGTFPQVDFSRRLRIQAGTQKVRMSTGAELQTRVPGVNLPVRFYFAYNPSVYRGNLQGPDVLSPSYFPNDATYQNALNTVAAPRPLLERRFMFRFALGRSF